MGKTLNFLQMKYSFVLGYFGDFPKSLSCDVCFFDAHKCGLSTRVLSSSTFIIYLVDCSLSVDPTVQMIRFCVQCTLSFLLDFLSSEFVMTFNTSHNVMVRANYSSKSGKCRFQANTQNSLKFQV
jgi:hypothetical protein